MRRLELAHFPYLSASEQPHVPCLPLRSRVMTSNSTGESGSITLSQQCRRYMRDVEEDVAAAVGLPRRSTTIDSISDTALKAGKITIGAKNTV